MPLAQLLDQGADRADLVRIEADGRLVQDDEVRFVHQRIGEPDALAESFRELADDAFLDVDQAALLEHGVHPFPAAPPAEALQPRAELQELPHPHVEMDGVVLRHVADPPPHLVRLVEDIETRHPRRAARRRHEAGEDAHGGRFARAVRPEEPDDLPATDRERKSVHGRAARIAFREVADLDHRDIVHRDWTGNLAACRAGCRTGKPKESCGEGNADRGADGPPAFRHCVARRL